MPDFAVIFDMDGVIVNSTPYHTKAWKQFLKKHGHHLTDEELKLQIHGKINAEIIQHFFPMLSKKEVNKYSNEKEELYRQIIQTHIISPEGLLDFVLLLQKKKVPIAVATAAPPVNVNFILEKLNLKKYFQIVVDESQIAKGKPDPEVYQKAAKKIGFPAQRCIVIEDAVLGIEAATRAGMRVIAITTTQKRSELDQADIIIDCFRELSYQTLVELINKTT